MQHPRHHPRIDKVCFFKTMSDCPYEIFPSGHCKSVVESFRSEVLSRIVQLGRQSQTSILVGSGINPTTAKRVLAYQHIGLREIHLTGGRWVEGEMWHRPEGMGMGARGNEWSVWRTSEEAIREVRSLADESMMK
jgi:copper homeostasis protein